MNLNPTLNKLGKIRGGQDGAIFDDKIFRFDTNGCGVVARLDTLEEVAKIRLEGEVVPHCNSVSFSDEYFAEGDELPLLWANVYNNYQNSENRREGQCCIFRLTREDGIYVGRLVGIVKIGFVEDTERWISPSKKDPRPYGNFVVDTVRGELCVFVMRLDANVTKHYIFELPRLADFVEVDGLPTLVLTESMVKREFETPYMRFMQGGAVRDGLLVSSEGFTNSLENPPALRCIDTLKGEELLCLKLVERGYTVEAELVEFVGDALYYSDAHGDLFEVK